ncbi:hypothetical protein QWA68_010964 [Fusarium oxysporum]|nr:hypothetical protein QWA68_010964 [Fusarium oxysporum]
MSLQGDHIRLLRLSADSSLSFTRVSLGDLACLYFVVLSYVWGDLSDTLPLDVSGHVIHATKNLHHVLDCLLASRFDELLWIDALCIDQQNPHERASQVAMMGDIYSNARYVLAFL